MQLSPFCSSRYTVFPEKSFHLCHTCTVFSTRSHKWARKYTFMHTRHFLFSTHSMLSIAQHSTETQHHLTVSNQLNVPSCFCTNHLNVAKSVLNIVPSISIKRPNMSKEREGSQVLYWIMLLKKNYNTNKLINMFGYQILAKFPPNFALNTDNCGHWNYTATCNKCESTFTLHFTVQFICYFIW